MTYKRTEYEKKKIREQIDASKKIGKKMSILARIIKMSSNKPKLPR